MLCRTRVLRVLRWVCRATGSALAALGFALLLVEWRAGHAYRALDTSLGPHATTGRKYATSTEPASHDHIDWEQLATINPDIYGWIVVEGSDISLPVVSSASVPDGFYLTHDLWGNPSRTGVPFLDNRCDSHGPHTLVYGHHLATGGQFSDLQKAYGQEVFDSLGTCRWYAPDEEVAFEPLCALLVSQDFEPIQRFSFADDAKLRSWIAALLVQAEARAPDSDERVARITRVMTLVTCASELSGQPWRTLVVFAT